MWPTEPNRTDLTWPEQYWHMQHLTKRVFLVDVGYVNGKYDKCEIKIEWELPWLIDKLSQTTHTSNWLEVDRLVETLY